MKPPVKILKYLLPEGFPRSTLMAVQGEPGTGKSMLLIEMAYKTLKMGEPVVFLTMEDTALTTVQKFLTMDWNVLPFLKNRSFKILDCFSYRLEKYKPRKIPERIKKLSDEISLGVDLVSEPDNYDLLWSSLERDLEELGMVERGMVLVDSMTELLTVVSDQADFLESLKNLKAKVCKTLFVPFVYSLHFGVFDQFRTILECFDDGIVDLRFSPTGLQKGLLIKQIRVRRMSGVHHRGEWMTFDIKRGEGVVPLE